MPTPKELEEQADALLAADMAETGFNGSILLDHHLKRRRSKEIYSRRDDLDVEAGMYHRPTSQFTAANDRRKHTDEN